MQLTSDLFNIFYFATEDVQHRLHGRFGFGAGAEIGAAGGLGVLLLIRRGDGLGLDGAHGHLAPADRLRHLLDPLLLGLELPFERLVHRRKRERDRLVVDVDLLRLRDDHPVERLVAFAN